MTTLTPATSSLRPKPKPRILAIGIQDRTFADSRMYARLRTLLRKFADIYYCSTAVAAVAALRKRSNPPLAVLIVDAGITQRRDVTVACVEYMRRGGRVVFAANFANYMPPTQDVRRFFSSFGVFWTFEDGGPSRGVIARKNRQLLQGDESAAWRCVEDEIVYRQAQVLGNVKKEHAVFTAMEAEEQSLAAESEKTESAVPLRNANDGCELLPRRLGPTRYRTPIAWAKQRYGYIGVIGDVNAQPESEVLVVCMLGLIDTVQVATA
ncbi:uncharacterized protein PV09_03241 [Verruconis gallopava]|uniref:Uncharacterized protein n=1 Tax=Verruconis gallopava TaxID=253628 RepID=A0A0D2B4C4_9PEZI|nr:uncharacterized protein PV09_03241 [Verruconis gallopava]KIW06069.1 hypothetical protein PV09_03241 [Verruconis gallopava]